MDDAGKSSADRGDRGIPPLAGLTTFDEAIKPGLGVDASVARLKRHHYALKRLHEIFTSPDHRRADLRAQDRLRPPRVSCAQSMSRRSASRVGEMREPPLGLEVVPRPERWRSSSTKFSRRRSTRSLLVLGLVQRRPARARRRARSPHGRHQPVDRRPLGPSLPVRPARGGRHDRLRPRKRSRN